MPSESARLTMVEAEDHAQLEALLPPWTGDRPLKFVTQNVHAAWQKARQRETSDSTQGDPSVPITAPVSLASGSADLEAVLAACTESVSGAELLPTDTWWAQRWIDNATPGEVAAMRALLF